MLERLVRDEKITLEKRIPLKVHFGEKGNTEHIKAGWLKGLACRVKSRTKNALSVALVLISICAYAHAKDDVPGIRADVDKRTVTIGDHIVYSITVRAPKGLEVRFPSFTPLNKIGIFEFCPGRTSAHQ